MRKKVTVLSVVLGLMLALAAPGFADTVTVGNQVAGPLSENVTVAGSANLANAPAPDLPWGTDIALAGNPVPPNAFALSVNQPFDVNFALGGVGPAEDDVVAGSEFLGTNFVEAGPGNLSVDTEDDFFD